MVAETPSRGSSRFPEIRLNLRIGSRSSQIVLPPSVQFAAASAVVAFAVAVCFFVPARPGYERALADKQAMVRAETATAGLDRALSDRDRLRARIAELQQKQSQLDFAVRTTALIETGLSQSATDPA